MAEKQVGTVTHWYDKIGVAVVEVIGKLSKGDAIKIKRGDDEFEGTISSIQIDHKDVDSASIGDSAAIKLSQTAKEGSVVFLVE